MSSASARFAVLPYLFELDDGYTSVGFQSRVEVAVEDFAQQLVAELSENYPLTLSELPSWVICRLAKLTQKPEQYFPEEKQYCEEGLFIVDLLVAQSDGRVLAKLQLQAGAPGVGILGAAGSEEAAKNSVSALKQALLDSCRDLEALTLEVVDPDTQQSYRYGYSAQGLLKIPTIE